MHQKRRINFFASALLIALVVAVGGYAAVRLSHAAGVIGDINGDGVVNVYDLSILLSDWNTNNAMADLNGDGTVNILDLSVLLSHWGQTSTPTPSPTPTPTITPSAGTPCGITATPPATYAHVIILLMENHDYNEVIGNAAAPYQSQLANKCGEATNYSSVGSPSLPNYIGLTSGNTQGSKFTSDCDPTGACTTTVTSIFDQVKALGKSWKAYEETMPSNCYLTNSGNYAVRHDPPPYYTAMRTDCSANDVPMGTTAAGNFLNDLNNNTLPNFSFITPNVCNDTHDCSVATGDAWLSSWVPKILNSPAYESGNTAFILTYDEGDCCNIIPMTVVAPSVHVGARSSSAFNHYSMLRSMEEMLGITTYLQNAATASSMRTGFNF